MNLIICTTPLQVLIAEKIIDLNPDEEFYGIMICPPYLNNKYKFYAKRLENKCNSFKILLLPSSNIIQQAIWLKKFYLFQQYFKNREFKKIFLASIDSSFIHCLLDKQLKIKIFTFDDGTANIISNSILKKGENSLKKNLFRKIFNIQMNQYDILEKSKLHFTIYPNMKNIISNTKLLKLFNEGDYFEHDGIKQQKKSILLGQPIFNDCEKNKRLIKKVVDSFNITYYFPHPRENYIIDHVQYIDTDLIFEDYFQKNLSNYHVKLFTFFSSSALNLYHIKNIDIVSIYDKSIQNRDYLEIYDLFKKLNITMIEI